MGRTILLIAFLVLSSHQIIAVNWELIFPEEYPLENELELLSIGAKINIDNPNEYLMGSRNGYAIISSLNNFDKTTQWNTVKLPVAFNITAIDVVNHQWLIGGAHGEFAIHQPPQNNDQGIEQLQEHWRIQNSPAPYEIYDLAVSGDTILAILDNGLNNRRDLYISSDQAKSWEKVVDQQWIEHLNVLNDTFYMLAWNENENPQLLRSQNGRSWEVLWTIKKQGLWSSNMQILYHADNTRELFTNEPRLYISLTFFSSRMPSGGFDGEHVSGAIFLSTKDGNKWLDHGSNITEGIDSTSRPYNPLLLPESSLHAALPEIITTDLLSDSGGNLTISTLQHSQESRTVNILEQFDGEQTTELFRADHAQRMHPDQIATGPTLVFNYGKKRSPGQTFYSLNEPFALSRTNRPDELENEAYVKQMMSVNGNFYSLFENLENTESEKLFISSDLNTWSEIPMPASIEEPTLTRANQQLILLGYNASDKIEGYILDKDWQLWFSGNGYPAGIAVTKPNNQVYNLTHYQDEIRVGRWNNKTEIFDITHTFSPESLHFNNLVSPNAQKLIVFGDSSEIVVINSDGTSQLINLESFFSEDEAWVEKVQYVNGYYYLLGPKTIRTKDFMSFELVPLPRDEPLIHVTGFGGFLYGFTQGAVFKTQVEPGYLDSLPYQEGWQHSDWLGWFQILDESTGHIKHLQLGNCWVQSINQKEHWIRTHKMGWVYLNADWTPWIWRFDNKHWYWMDHSSWPPRAWDANNATWTQL